MTLQSSLQRQKGSQSCVRGELVFVLVSLWTLPVGFTLGQPGYESNVVIVQFAPGTAIGTGAAKTGLDIFDRTASRYRVREIKRVFPFLDHVQLTPKTAQNLTALRRTYYVHYDADDDPAQVARALTAVPDVVYAEPVPTNHVHGRGVKLEPNDSLFAEQIYLRNLRLPEAWEIVKGEDATKPVVIAIVDAGGEWRHEDLRANAWTNQHEIPGNGIDDDGNGFIDDVHGANFANEDATNNDPTGVPESPGAWHGTTVAGAASAVTDNAKGIAGAAWNAQLMHVNAGCRSGGLGICHGYEGILYAAANGADIINASWGGYRKYPTPPTRMQTQTLDLATDMGALVVASAGNDGADVTRDYVPIYPYAHPRVLSVGATFKDSRTKAYFSNYGKNIDVFAAGVSIITTAPDGKYSHDAQGTSFAAPLASGVAALVKTRFPEISADELREQIRLASENMDNENRGYAEGRLGRGYINAEAAVQNPTLPAVRLSHWSWTDADGDSLLASQVEDVTVKVVVVNHLADAQQLHVGLVPFYTYPYIAMPTAEQVVGTLPRGDSAEVTFEFTVSSEVPLYSTPRFYVQMRDGAYVDETDQIRLDINNMIDVTHGVLSVLYVSTDGDNWLDNSGWDIARVPLQDQLAEWYGVTLSRYWIKELSLGDNALSGTIPGELGRLRSLDELDLHGNALSGRIPREFGRIRGLNRLFLQENSLSGAIPNELENLVFMEEMLLHENSLSGTIPAGLAENFSLKRLSLHSNSLSGSIPTGWRRFGKLQSLLLHENALSGAIPKQLGGLYELEELRLDNNSLSGSIPSTLGSSMALRTLNVSNNQLTGEIPRELGTLARLESLNLSKNDLSGTVPPELGALSKLKWLYLDGNSLSGKIPNELGKLRQLQRLSLSSNELSGVIPGALGRLSKLETLALGSNAISGAIPRELGNLSNLRWMWLGNNSLSGAIPSELGNLSNLRWIWLGSNSLTESLPRELGSLSRLEVLAVENNSISGAIPAELGNLSHLRRLWLNNNSISGTIPRELGSLPMLQQLWLQSNNLSGSVPEEIGKLSKLEWLDLSYNALTGKLPRSLMQLNDLQHLHFDGQDLCAPQDETFQAWLNSIPDKSGPTCADLHLTGRIDDQTFIEGETIAPLVLPEAAGGAGPYGYTLCPTLPAGLIFSETSRTLSGIPSKVSEKAPCTYTATDSRGVADSLTFSLEVVSLQLASRHTGLPEAFEVRGNYPNPFRTSTRLVFNLPSPARVSVEVLDVVGRHVLTLPGQDLDAGWEQSIELSGIPMSSGLYLYQIHATLATGSEIRRGKFLRIR